MKEFSEWERNSFYISRFRVFKWRSRLHRTRFDFTPAKDTWRTGIAKTGVVRIRVRCDSKVANLQKSADGWDYLQAQPARHLRRDWSPRLCASSTGVPVLLGRMWGASAWRVCRSKPTGNVLRVIPPLSSRCERGAWARSLEIIAKTIPRFDNVPVALRAIREGGLWW